MAQQQCTVLLLKLRGSNFPVKDSGIEGTKADPFFQIRSNYALGTPHAGEHTTEYAYKSKKVLQDLNPKFKTIAIDLQSLVNMNMQQKLLFDFYDWDRFSSPDFMSYIELTPQQLLERQRRTNSRLASCGWTAPNSRTRRCTYPRCPGRLRDK
jgi:hypothetical protein